MDRATNLSEPAERAEANPGSTPVPGVGESVSLSRSSQEESSFRRDAETHARDGRAPQAEGGLYSRRRLPHFEKPWAIYAVTMSARSRKSLSPLARTIVLNAITHFHNERYELIAACVMPDHAHLLFQPWPKERSNMDAPVFWSIAELMHSLKSFTAHTINDAEKSRGPIWEEESFDRYIRSVSDLHEKFCYICRNPWESRVVRGSEDYPWLWTQENSGSTPVPGLGESVPLSQASRKRDCFGETPKPTPETGVLPGDSVATVRECFEPLPANEILTT